MKKILLLSAVSIVLSGCISVKSYVDPKYNDVSLANVAIAENTTFDLETEFIRKGKVVKSADAQLKKTAAAFFEKAGIVNAPEGTKLKITCENLADIGDAAAKGVGTGLTLGLAGSTVTDGYEYTFELEDASGIITTKTYAHAIHSTVGNASAPIENIEAVTPLVGFEAVFEDMFLTFLKEMNAADKLAWQPSVEMMSFAP